MKVTHVAICQTEAALEAGRPALTPELLAACGARYSRNNEGLDSILQRIDPANLDRSVDSIFRMIDYGHQSIADMVPVAVFIDGISLWLAYFIWTLCPVAGGQESSTRYLQLIPEDMDAPEKLGVPSELHAEWKAAMEKAFIVYNEALEEWRQLASARPELTRIPAEILADETDAGRRKVARMQRNYAFDRARYFIPLAARTNIMLEMSARAWVNVCQLLLSHVLPEARRLGEALHAELGLCAPRLIKHAVAKDSAVKGQAEAFKILVESARKTSPWLEKEHVNGPHPWTAFIDVTQPEDVGEKDVCAALQNHDNRYAWIGDAVRRISVRFGWAAVTMGEIRDLNRHRTGNKYCPLVPLGFYGARDQLPADVDRGTADRHFSAGRKLSRRALKLLRQGDPSYIYWTLLGTQYKFEHLTTADKFIYEAELRTAAGAHYQYARHLGDALEEWFKIFPATKRYIKMGEAEPE